MRDAPASGSPSEAVLLSALHQGERPAFTTGPRLALGARPARYSAAGGRAATGGRSNVPVGSVAVLHKLHGSRDHTRRQCVDGTASRDRDFARATRLSS